MLLSIVVIGDGDGGYISGNENGALNAGLPRDGSLLKSFD